MIYPVDAATYSQSTVFRCMDAMRWGLFPLSYPVDAVSTCMDALSYPQQRAP